ncbi:MAG: hypothetical protein GDA36_13240 [Rhodobacteraceae bacterium]|nr:hypothetical protein [Paracoccaceae bacterium]
MTHITPLVFALLGLAACGVDGEPIRPGFDRGVAFGSSGIDTAGRVGLHQGPFSINLGELSY